MALFKKMGDRLAENVSSWVAISGLKAVARTIQSGAAKMFFPQQQRHAETIEQAQARLGLDDNTLNKVERNFKVIARLLFLLLVAIFGYIVYLCFQGNFHSALVSLGIALVVAGLTFRYHFWWFQLKRRKLGCSFKEWRNDTFKF